MTTVLVIDAAGRVFEAVAPALQRQGWQVRRADQAAGALQAGPGLQAILVAAQPDHPAGALAQVMAVRAHKATADVPVLLVADLNRTGWDRTFDTEEAFQVDALFDMPVDSAAVVRRLQGILQARQAVEPLKHSADFDAIVARAIANEEAAEDFYKRAAGCVREAATRRALEELAADERSHKQILLEFKAGRRSLPAGRIPAGSLVETLGTPELTADLKPADAFLLAARKEKLAVELYENWAKLYPAGPERDLLTGLAEVERRHKARVEEMFVGAAFPESW